MRTDRGAAARVWRSLLDQPAATPCPELRRGGRPWEQGRQPRRCGVLELARGLCRHIGGTPVDRAFHAYTAMGNARGPLWLPTKGFAGGEGAGRSDACAAAARVCTDGRAGSLASTRLELSGRGGCGKRGERGNDGEGDAAALACQTGGPTGALLEAGTLQRVGVYVNSHCGMCVRGGGTRGGKQLRSGLKYSRGPTPLPEWLPRRWAPLRRPRLPNQAERRATPEIKGCPVGLSVFVRGLSCKFAARLRCSGRARIGALMQRAHQRLLFDAPALPAVPLPPKKILTCLCAGAVGCIPQFARPARARGRAARAGRTPPAPTGAGRAGRLRERFDLPPVRLRGCNR
jgi:hypothetical protein